MSISWATVAASAAIAAGISLLVTLATDAFARPRLEDRKARILERYKARRDFGYFLGRSQMDAQLLAMGTPDELSSVDVESWHSHTAETLASIREGAKRSQSTLVIFLRQEPEIVRTATAFRLGNMIGVIDSSKPLQQKGEELSVVIEPLNNYFNCDTWSKRRRYRRQL